MTGIKEDIELTENFGMSHESNTDIIEKMNIAGYVQLHIERWHDDPNGPLEVNGRKGYYTDGNENQTFPAYSTNLLTTPGRDEYHQLCFINTTAVNRGINFIGVSAETTAPASGDTSLAGEITGGGMDRADADTKTHTVATNTSTIAHTFTATTLQTALHKAALSNQAGPPVAGIMSHAAVFSADVTLNPNDKLQLTWTITLG